MKFPKARFKYQNVFLETRPETIDFWACLETYEPDLTYFLTEVVTENRGTFVDVGGHIGRFTTLMAKKGWDVITFEPLPTNYNALQNNLKINNVSDNAQVYNAGLGDETIEKTMFFNKKELGEASVAEQVGGSSESIKIMKFDDVYSNLKFKDLCIAKVDVEGFEENVISGMKHFIEAELPLFVIELWEEKSANLIAFLKSLGYKRLHIFWFHPEKHQDLITKMYEKYNRYSLRYDYE